MKTYNNNETRNSRYTRKAVENLKAMIKATATDEIKLPVYGIQIYAAYLDTEEYREYYVVMAAERDIKTGRYYFITREGDRIAWSRLDTETLITAAVDFADRAAELEKQAAERLRQLEEHSRAAIDSDVFFYYVRPLLDLMEIRWRYINHYWTNDGRTVDAVEIERTTLQATRKPGEPAPHWLTTRTDEQLADMKAERTRQAEALHAAGHYTAAAYVAELTGHISDAQTARRERAETAARLDTDTTTAELTAYAATIDADTARENYGIYDRAEILAKLTRKTREAAADLLTAWVATADRATIDDKLGTNNRADVLAFILKESSEQAVKRLTEWATTTTTAALAAAAYNKGVIKPDINDRADVLAYVLQLPADVAADYIAAREAAEAETIARADVETLAATWPGLTRAEILAELLTITPDRAALMLADIDTPQPDPVAWLTDTTNHAATC